jgi:hypothetical protein
MVATNGHEGAREMTEHPLDGTTWRLIAYRSGDEIAEPVPDATVTLWFRLPYFGGRSAVNHYQGYPEFSAVSVEEFVDELIERSMDDGADDDADEDTDDADEDMDYLQSHQLRFPRFHYTLMGGLAEHLALESVYKHHLWAVRTWALEDGILTLQNARGVTILRFAPSKG